MPALEPADAPGPAATTEVLVVGEALVDIVQRPDGSSARHPGGSPANVALGLARLGHLVRFATRTGSDEDGDRVREHLRGDGVVLTDGSTVDGATSTATAVIDGNGAASYVFDLVWELPEVGLGTAGHVHTGSIAANLAPGAGQVRQLLPWARERATTSYDPNLRPRIIGAPDEERPGVEALVGASDVVKSSDEDLAWLYPGEGADQVARRWVAGGPSLVVVTRGSQGATAWLVADPGSPITVEPRRAEVVDTVGAGDAFMSGLISGLLDLGLLGGPEQRQALATADPEQVRTALRRATLTSSLTCERPGADPPTRAEIAAVDR
ncbi:MAG TPA: carbohydrate kinase [Actinomycetales bacterium]|jgi:fructokinase